MCGFTPSEGACRFFFFVVSFLLRSPPGFLIFFVKACLFRCLLGLSDHLKFSMSQARFVGKYGIFYFQLTKKGPGSQASGGGI